MRQNYPQPLIFLRFGKHVQDISGGLVLQLDVKVALNSLLGDSFGPAVGPPLKMSRQHISEPFL